VWPFAGILDATNRELHVPGQDSPQTYIAVRVGQAYSGLKADASGQMLWKGSDFTTYSPTKAGTDLSATEDWINAEARATFDPADYEATFNYVSGDGPGAVYGSALDTWISCDTSPEWYVRAIFTFAISEVTGIIAVREKANTSNVKAGTAILRAVELGL